MLRTSSSSGQISPKSLRPIQTARTVTTLATRIGTGGEAGIKTEVYGITVYQYVFLLELPIGLVRRTIKSEEGREGNSHRSLLYRG